MRRRRECGPGGSNKVTGDLPNRRDRIVLISLLALITIPALYFSFLFEKSNTPESDQYAIRIKGRKIEELNTSIPEELFIDQRFVFVFSGKQISVHRLSENWRSEGVAVFDTGELDDIKVASSNTEFFISGREGNGGRNNWWRVKHRYYRCALGQGCDLVRQGDFAVYSIGYAVGHFFVSEYDWDDHARADGNPPPYKTEVKVYADRKLTAAINCDFGISQFFEKDDRVYGFSPFGINKSGEGNSVYLYTLESGKFAEANDPMNRTKTNYIGETIEYATDALIIQAAYSDSLRLMYDNKLYNASQDKIVNNIKSNSNIVFSNNRFVYFDSGDHIRFVENAINIK